MNLRDGITEQFSGHGDRADIWRAFDLFLDTDRYLNLGYSAWYQPHAHAASQRRLATVIGRRLSTAVSEPHGTRLLDVGCGRGGPAIHLARRFGFEVLGVDLVRHNVTRATEHARQTYADASFVLGDAAELPIATASHGAAMAVDALVYLPERQSVLAEVARTLTPGSPLVFSDLVRRRDLGNTEHDEVDAFAAAWDMAAPATRDEYQLWLTSAGFRVEAVEDLTPNSVGQFRRWTRPFLAFIDSPLRSLFEVGFSLSGLDPEQVSEQVRRAHRALPHLRHMLFRAHRTE